jgi:hypothetical protein
VGISASVIGSGDQGKHIKEGLLCTENWQKKRCNHLTNTRTAYKNCYKKRVAWKGSSGRKTSVKSPREWPVKRQIWSVWALVKLGDDRPISFERIEWWKETTCLIVSPWPCLRLGVTWDCYCDTLGHNRCCRGERRLTLAPAENGLVITLNVALSLNESIFFVLCRQ